MTETAPEVALNRGGRRAQGRYRSVGRGHAQRLAYKSYGEALRAAIRQH